MEVAEPDCAREGAAESPSRAAAGWRIARVALVAFLLAGCRSYWTGGKSLGPAAWIQKPCANLAVAGDSWQDVDLQGAVFRVPNDFRLHHGEGGRSLWLERAGDRISASLTTEHDAIRSVGDFSGKMGRCEIEKGTRVADIVAYASGDGDYVATALWPDVNRTYSLLLTVTSNRPLAGDSLRAVLALLRFPYDSVNFKRP